MGVSQNELRKIRKYTKETHLDIIYDYIVNGYSQADIYEDSDVDNQWDISAIIRAYHFNQKGKGAYQRGNSSGKYKEEHYEPLKHFIGQGYPGYEEGEGITFDQFLTNQARKQSQITQTQVKQSSYSSPSILSQIWQWNNEPKQFKEEQLRREQLRQEQLKVNKLYYELQELMDKPQNTVDGRRGMEALQQYEDFYEQGYGETRSKYPQFLKGLKYAVMDERVKYECTYRLAQLGDAGEQNNLGVIYAKGEGVNQNEREAIKWYKLASENGDAYAKQNLALRYKKGSVVQRDYSQAIQLYQQAYRELKDESILTHIGECYFELALEAKKVKDLRAAYQYYSQGSEYGHRGAKNSLAIMYVNGEYVSQDYERAVSLFTEAAQLGDKYAMGNLARRYKNGQGVSKNYIQALMWYEKAFEKGYEQVKNELAQLALQVAELLLKKKEKEEKDRAFKYAEKAVQYGEQKALTLIAECVYLGYGTPVDVLKAIQLYKKAEAMGIEIDDDELAECYYKQGVTELNEGNEVRGIAFLEQAAKRENEDAVRQLAECYFEGEGVEQDDEVAQHWYEKLSELQPNYYYRKNYLVEIARKCFNQYEDERGIRWCERAAEKECGEAMVILGDYYYYGGYTECDDEQDGEKDYALANEWYERSVDYGGEDFEAYYKSQQCVVKLGEEAFERSDYEQAIEYYEQVGRYGNEGLYQVYTYLAGQALVEKDYEQAKVYYEKALEQEEEVEEEARKGILALADFYFQSEQWEDAIEWYEKVDEESENIAISYYNEGKKQMECEMGIYRLEKASRLGHIGAMHSLAEFYLNKEERKYNKREGIGYWHQALEKGDEEAFLKLSQAYCEDRDVRELIDNQKDVHPKLLNY